MARVTLKYSQEELLVAFKKLGISNVDFEDEDEGRDEDEGEGGFAGHVNSLLTFLDLAKRKGIDLDGTTVFVSKKDSSNLRITLVSDLCYAHRFHESLKVFQEFMSSVVGESVQE